MEFEDKTGARVDTIVAPTDLKGNTDLYIAKNSRVDLTLYVIVAIDEDEGDYEEIAISATSDNDNAQIEYLYFNLTVILPNIRIGDDKSEYYIEPDEDIEEGDDIDISVKIYNDGGAETDQFYVFFYNGKRESSNELPGVSTPGDSRLSQEHQRANDSGRADSAAGSISRAVVRVLQPQV